MRGEVLLGFGNVEVTGDLDKSKFRGAAGPDLSTDGGRRTLFLKVCRIPQLTRVAKRRKTVTLSAPAGGGVSHAYSQATLLVARTP